jgi:hypothetical protein
MGLSHALPSNYRRQSPIQIVGRRGSADRGLTTLTCWESWASSSAESENLP